MLNRNVKKILQLIYPSRCPICDKIWNPGQEQSLRKKSRDSELKNRVNQAKSYDSGTSVLQHCCPKCRDKLPWIQGAHCMKCGKPVLREEEYCDDCRKRHHLFAQGTAAFTYSGGLPDALFRMKFRNRRDYLDFFADVMVWSSRNKLRLWRPQVIVPVPMHWRKKGRRGYNQAELLADRISRRTGIPMEKNLLRCVRMTSEQKRLSRSERQKNLRDSFQIRQSLQGLERVLIVDDVYTTGSTVDELARVLKKAGVKDVYFLVLCTGKGKKDGMHGEKSVLY